MFTAENGALALEFVKRFGIHVVVSDQRMPSMTGVELLRQVKELSPNSVRMLLTGYSDLAAIVGSINEGEVFRFVKKPWDNAEMQKTHRRRRGHRDGAGRRTARARPRRPRSSRRRSW